MATAETAVPNELIAAAVQYRPNDPRGGGAASAWCALTTAAPAYAIHDVRPKRSQRSTTRGAAASGTGS